MKVSNRKCIRRLGFRSMKAARTRNVIAILAIALTTVLFTSLFTIAASINYSFQQENFRQAGGDMHGTIKNLTWEQVEELRDDPLIVESGARMFLGMPEDIPFHKSHVEVSYLESQEAPHYFCVPEVGSLPAEGTNQIATDTHVLSLLGVEPEIGAEVSFSFYIDQSTPDKKLVSYTGTLSGWWSYDPAIVANHILLPSSAAEELVAQGSGDEDSMTGKWSLDLMFKNALHIREDVMQVLANHGYQTEDNSQPNYLSIGVNWGYSGAQLGENFDATTVIAIVVILLLIIFTGYLIIYNVFQISVTNDIRFYGLLKTIGTTGRQLKRIVRQQALLLSLAGIPLGLIGGFLIGNKLTPVIMNQLSYKNTFVSFNPLIFLGAALFALFTVFLSCARPGRMAAKVSPVEAVRYTEGSGKTGGKKAKAGKRSAKNGASLPKMAWANLGRSRSRTVVTVISLTLALVLATLTYTVANGFDMDKYLQTKANVDFILGDASYFQNNNYIFSGDTTIPETVIDEVNAQGGITDSGRIYGTTSDMEEFVTEEWYRSVWSKWNDPETLDQMVENMERTEDGLLADRVNLYGMEDFPLSLLNVLDGDLAPLSDPSQRAIAAVYNTDDYNSTEWDSHWAKLGDTVTIRYVTQREYFYRDTGEIVEDVDAAYEGDRPFGSRAVEYRDVDYTVCAIVNVPMSISYRYYGADQFVLGAEQFVQDSGTDGIMTYIYDTTDESRVDMESFLTEYTDSVQPLYDYESRETYEAEFEGFQGMFFTMGSALSGIVGLVGVLNFINAVLTGILSRKREFAVLQSVGMTGKQLKTMLVCEGLYYTVLSLLLCLLLTVGVGPLVGGAVGNILWFFSYHLTVTPILVVLPLFLLLGVLVPLWTYRVVARRTIVERLREMDA